MFIPVEVRPSSIFGKGLFPVRNVKRGKVICSFTSDANVITEDEYLTAIKAERYLVVRTGTRYVGKYFTYTEEPDTELNFFNHSFEPNLLVHCGVVIALRDIPAGDELTIDYRYLIDDTEIGVYNDAATGRPIRGLPARQTLLETSRKLIALMEQLGDDWTGT
jgi:SET domain-containing protein